jgi:hypothetical protein
MMLVTATLLSPSWEAIDPQKFSAAVTWILPAVLDEVAAEPDPHPAATAATSRSARPPPTNRALHLAIRSILPMCRAAPSLRSSLRLLEIVSNNDDNRKGFPLQLQATAR